MKDFIEKAREDSSVMLLTVIAGFLLGMVIGILIAPVKKGLSIGSNNTIIGCDDDDDDEEKDKDCKKKRRCKK